MPTELSPAEVAELAKRANLPVVPDELSRLTATVNATNALLRTLDELDLGETAPAFYVE